MKPLFPDVIVNGETIPSATIASEAQNHASPAGKPGFAWKAAAKAMVVRTLLLQEAAKLNLAADPQETESGKWETEEEALIRAVLDSELNAEEVTDEAITTVFENHRESFRAPTLYQPSHILFVAKQDDLAARAEAKSNAEKLLKDLAKNPKAFGRLAKSHSDCPSKDNHGSLGQIGSGDTVPEFEAVMDILDAGQTHPEPVDTRFGFHILRMDEKDTGKLLPLSVVKSQIMEKLEQVAWAKAAHVFTKRLVDQAEITGVDMNITASKAA